MRQIPLLKVFMSPTLDAELLRVIHSGYVGEGVQVKKFESLLCETFKLPRILAVNSCTSALQLALRLANVGYGDVVLTTPATNMATNSVILAAGARPVWVDIDPLTGRVDPSKLPDVLPQGTKALTVMDWGGVPCDLDVLYAYTQSHGIKLIEDAAHSLGAQYEGEFVGRQSDFCCFSFQAVKTLSTCDGGALVCKSKDDHDRGRLLRWFGIDRDNPSGQRDLRCEANISEYGYKFHMNDVAATIGLANLEHHPKLLDTMRSNARFYTSQLTLLSKINPNIQPMCVPSEEFGNLPTYWLYTMRVLKRRDEFADALRDRGIACSKVHSRNDRHSCMPMTKDGDLPGVDEFYRTQLSIPCGWWVSEEDRRYIVDAIAEVSDKFK